MGKVDFKASSFRHIHFLMSKSHLFEHPITEPDFDWQQLKQLAGEDATFEVELLEMFLSDAESSLKRLEQALAAHSIQTIEDTAHSLRGASANVGAIALARSVRRLEQTARSGHLTEAQTLLQEIDRHCQKVRAYLHSRR